MLSYIIIIGATININDKVLTPLYHLSSSEFKNCLGGFRDKFLLETDWSTHNMLLGAFLAFRCVFMV